MFKLGGPTQIPVWFTENSKLNLILANSFWQRLFGLHLWTDWGKSPRGLLFANCSAVHTLGLKNHIDIIFMAKTGKLLKLFSKAKPNRIYGCKAAYYVLELPPGYIVSSCLDRQKYLYK